MEYTPEKIVIFTFLFIMTVGLMFILIVVLYRRQKNKLILAQERQKEVFDKELIQTKYEIREETLRTISWELHDNIGQLITLSKIQTNNLDGDPEAIQELSNSLALALKELRALSKSVNPEYLSSKSLSEAIKDELNRFDRLNFIETNFIQKGTEFPLNSKEEIFLYRILQEAISNTIKHAKATQLTVQINFEPNSIGISIKDNGIGFSSEQQNKGLGLQNMRKRAELIGADFEVNSTEQGTEIHIQYNRSNNGKEV